MDDEEPLARLGMEMLYRSGYEVTVRTSSTEALAAFRAQPDKFALIISDQTMPNLTGLELAKEIRRTHPEVPIILTTGFSEGIEEKAQALGIPILMKPVASNQMALAVRKALDKTPLDRPVEEVL